MGSQIQRIEGPNDVRLAINEADEYRIFTVHDSRCENHI